MTATAPELRTAVTEPELRMAVTVPERLWVSLRGLERLFRTGVDDDRDRTGVEDGGDETGVEDGSDCTGVSVGELERLGGLRVER
ncbi:hypothetical protein CFP56_020248 [Quercus suber]|uniref:Uncharacterized protein n=1 Tax=Quercus suber TaxID=58331 RepID=A0AAW0KGW0_QUESU